MPRTPAKFIVRTLRRLKLDSLTPRGSDAELLGKFVDQHDEAAFEELLARHGGMVLGVCRRHLGSGPDAEDAFQAVFLALARSAARIARRESLGGWLYRVATFVSRKVVLQNARRRAGVLPTDLSDEHETDRQFGELCSVVGEEVRALPDRLRSAVVLCYLEGRSTAEVSGMLGCPRGTVESRLAAARRRLRVRLVRRGLAPAVAAGFELVLGEKSTAASPTIVARTLDAVSQYCRVGNFAGAVTERAIALVAEVNLTVAPRRTAIVLAVISSLAVLLAAGTVLALRPGAVGEPDTPKPAASADNAPSVEGAVAIGTAQFRHTGWYSRAYFTDGGNTMLVVSAGIAIRWWDVQTGRKLHEINLKGDHHDATFASDGELLAIVGQHLPDGESGDYKHVLWLIDAASRKLVHTIDMPTQTGGNHQAVRISADGKRVFVEYQGDIQIIDGKTGDELLRHKARFGAGAIAASRDGKLIAFGRNDVYLWRWETGEEPKKLMKVPGGGIEFMKFSPDGKTLFVSNRGKTISCWDVETGRQTGLRLLRYWPGALKFSPDGKTIAIPTSSRTPNPPEGGHAIDLVDASTWQPISRILLSAGGMEQVSWSKDGTRIAGVTDHRAWAFDVKSGRLLGPNDPGHVGPIAGMDFGPDGTLFTASDDGTVRSWDPVTGTPGRELTQDYWVRGLSVSPDGTLVAGSALRNDLRIWDAKSGKQRFKLLGNGMMGGKRSVRFAPDGKRLIAWGDDEIVRVWDVRNGKLLSEHSTSLPAKNSDPDNPFAADMRFMETMAIATDISADGTALALSNRNTLRILDPMTGAQRQTLTVGAEFVESAAFSRDGKFIAVASRGKSIQTKLPDGRIRHSVENEYPVTLWDLASAKPLWTATAEGSAPRLAFSPDNSRVAIVSSVFRGPSRVWVWDASNGREVGRIELPSCGYQLAFDRTGKRLAVSFDDCTALIYDLETALKQTK